MAPLPSLTKTWHNASYDAISPSRPTLSVAGKTVVITGGGRGIGAEIARAYAMAGASKVVLIGRTESALSDTRERLQSDFSSTETSYHVADIADEVAMQKIAKNVGGWNVLILNAGLLAKKQPVHASDPSAWWRTFETNVKGAMVTAHAFLPLRSTDAAIIGISADMLNTPVSSKAVMGVSAYVCSKIAQVKLLEFLAAENPEVHVVSVHPGVVETGMLEQFRVGVDLGPEIIDDVKLPAHFLVWVVSEEARFLNGKYVCVNWDVEELKAKAKEIEKTCLLTANISGWPYVDISDSQSSKI